MKEITIKIPCESLVFADQTLLDCAAIVCSLRCEIESSVALEVAFTLVPDDEKVRVLCALMSIRLEPSCNKHRYLPLTKSQCVGILRYASSKIDFESEMKKGEVIHVL